MARSNVVLYFLDARGLAVAPDYLSASGASANLPVVLLTLYWKKCNTGGVVAGLTDEAEDLVHDAWVRAVESLTVEDRQDRLLVRYGRFSWPRRSFPYRKMTAATPGRTTPVDGWGIHWVLGRGWTYNLWGRECVVIQMGRTTVRIGTDDSEGLASLLRARIEERADPAPGDRSF